MGGLFIAGCLNPQFLTNTTIKRLTTAPTIEIKAARPKTALIPKLTQTIFPIILEKSVGRGIIHLAKICEALREKQKN